MSIESVFGDIPAKIAIAKIAGSPFELLDDHMRLLTSMREIVDSMGWNRRQEVVEKFEPMGTTLGIVLAESGIFVHTWPEKGKARFNFELCAQEANFEGLPELIRDKFESTDLFFEEFNDENGIIRLKSRQLITPPKPLSFRQLTL